MVKFSRLFVLFLVLFLPVSCFAASHGPVLKENTLGAFYIDAGRIFNIYSTQAAEIMKPENREKLAEIEEKMRQYVPAGFKLSEMFVKLEGFARKEIFLPDGAMWFSIDADFRPALSIKARIKPLEFFEYLESLMGKSQAVPQKREKDLIQFEIPTSDFNMHLSIKPDGIFLQPVNEKSAPAGKQWQSLTGRAANAKTLVAAEVDMNAIKGVFSRNMQNARHSNCIANLRVLSAAVEMYGMDNQDSLKALDQKLLIEKKYLTEEMRCPEGGAYSMTAGANSETSEISCSSHGSVRVPATSEDARSFIPAQLQPFEMLRINVGIDLAELNIKLNDKNILEQWLAIGKQQLQAIRHMAENQLGQLPEADKQKGLQMLNSVKLSADSEWLNISVSGLDEKTMISGFAGAIGAAAAIAIPNFVKARENAQNKSCDANRRMLSGACEMYLMDKGKLPPDLKIETLVKEGYLKSAPVCFQKGIYSIKQVGDEVKVECSQHPAD